MGIRAAPMDDAIVALGFKSYIFQAHRRWEAFICISLYE